MVYDNKTLSLYRFNNSGRVLYSSDLIGYLDLFIFRSMIWDVELAYNLKQTFFAASNFISKGSVSDDLHVAAEKRPHLSLSMLSNTLEPFV